MYKWRPLTYNSRTNTIQIRVSYFFLGAERWNSTGGIPQVKWRPLVDMSCISVAPLRTIHELILSKFVCRIFFNYVKMALGVM